MRLDVVELYLWDPELDVGLQSALFLESLLGTVVACFREDDLVYTFLLSKYLFVRYDLNHWQRFPFF